MGSNFVGAKNELKELDIDNKKVSDFCANIQMKWEFNPPSAPHMGGVWERMVPSRKEITSGLTADNVLTDTRLYTFLTKDVNILDRRPLTHLSDDPADLTPLTPNHLLLGMHRNWSVVASVDDKDVASRRKWRQVQALTKPFWARWTKKYIPTLLKQ